MRKTIVYSSPNIVILGRVMEVIRSTHVKCESVVLDGLQCRINPAYDLDE